VSHHLTAEKPCEDCGNPFEGTAAARYCPACRWKHRGRTAKKYIWTPERDQVLRERYDGKIRNRAAEIAGGFGWPTNQIKMRAGQLGLTHPAYRRDWTKAEAQFLWEHAGSRTTHWISKQLQRSEASVVLKLRRMKISRRYRNGYTLRDLELCFGCDHHSIDRWIRDGWLKGRRRGTRRRWAGGSGNGPADPWVFSDEAILEFIKSRPMAFRLDKVDQFWFMDLVLSNGLVRRALAQERALEAA
jgi:hypothetical protein